MQDRQNSDFLLNFIARARQKVTTLLLLFAFRALHATYEPQLAGCHCCNYVATTISNGFNLVDWSRTGLSSGPKNTRTVWPKGAGPDWRWVWGTELAKMGWFFFWHWNARVLEGGGGGKHPAYGMWMQLPMCRRAKYAQMHFKTLFWLRFLPHGISWQPCWPGQHTKANAKQIRARILFAYF